MMGGPNAGSSSSFSISVATLKKLSARRKKPSRARFTDFTSRRYESKLAYSSADYREYLLTTSTYRMLEPTAAQAVLDGTVAAVDAHGGKIEFQIYTDVALARRVGG